MPDGNQEVPAQDEVQFETALVPRDVDPLDALVESLRDNATAETQALVFLGVKAIALVKETREAEREDEQRAQEAERENERRKREFEREERSARDARVKEELEARRKHELDLWAQRDFPLIKLGVFVLLSILVGGIVLVMYEHVAPGASMISAAVTAMVAAALYMIGAKTSTGSATPTDPRWKGENSPRGADAGSVPDLSPDARAPSRR